MKLCMSKITHFGLALCFVWIGVTACIPPPGRHDFPLPPPPPPPGASVSVRGVLPPPPPFVLPAAPSVVYAPTVRTYYVAGVDYDVFYEGGYFYTYHSGGWYCANRPGSGWVSISVESVPAPLRAGPPRPGWRPPAPGPARRVTSFKSSLPPGVQTRGRGRASGSPSPPSGFRATPSNPGRVDPPRAQPAPPGRGREDLPPGLSKGGSSNRARPKAPGRAPGGPPGRSKQRKR